MIRLGLYLTVYASLAYGTTVPKTLKVSFCISEHNIWLIKLNTRLGRSADQILMALVLLERNVQLEVVGKIQKDILGHVSAGQV